LSNYHLGHLAKVDLRNIWLSESSDFTPWLAREENLVILAETLGLELELEAQEKAVGPFRADILCKDIGTNAWVLIENQLERTDHAHLGQLLTYASGLEAVTIVWIAARFTEEHRSTLDWLNRITDETFRFFGVEVELWRIGESPAAPRFNIVSKPNNWNKLVTQAARAIDESALTATRSMQLAYWSAFGVLLMAKGGPLAKERKPQPQSWMSYSVGRSGFGVNASQSRPKRQVRAELYISNAYAKPFFHLLHQQRFEIEGELGYTLDWDELPEGRDTRISVALHDTDPEDQADWPRQHEWLATRLNQFHRVFAPRVKALNHQTWKRNPEISS
jgi:hypothetical protein